MTAINKSGFSWERFLKVPVVGILRNITIEEVISILPLYQAAGLTTIEITMNTPHAEGIIRYAINRHSDSLNIGAGTVCNMKDLTRALEAGAQFIVTPIIDEHVIGACIKKKIPIFPGAFTPTEIYRAWALGANMVKVFPATSLGPKYIREMKGPLDQIKLMPSGGVDLHNFIEFFDAGAEGLGIGSQLFDKKMIREKNFEALAERFEQFARKLDAGKTTRKVATIT